MKNIYYLFLVVFVPVLFVNSLVGITFSSSVLASSTFTGYSTPGNNSFTNGITRGADGNMWFTEYIGNSIGKITPNGNITEYSTGGGHPLSIATGSDGSMWFAPDKSGYLGKINTSGIITDYALPITGDAPYSVTTGSDGSVWFSEFRNGKVGRYVPASGGFMEYTVPVLSGNTPDHMAVDNDGNLWAPDNAGNTIIRLSQNGSYDQYPTPTQFSHPQGMALGPDGNIWFTENTVQKIGRITPSGSITEFDQFNDPNGSHDGRSITAGADGKLWFVMGSAGTIGSITTTGEITVYHPPSQYSGSNDIASDAQGNIWYTGSPNTINEYKQFTLQAPENLASASSSQSPVLSWNNVDEATSYNIYRDGTNIDTAGNSSYTDTTASDGTHTYYITAVASGGESTQSNAISVLVDKTPPSINSNTSPAPNSSGWNNSNTTVSFTCSDSGSGVASCPPSTSLTSEGTGQIITGTATDNAGNTSSTSAMVNIDKTAPVLSALNWTNNPLQSGQNTTLMATATDSLSGVAGVSYSLNGGTPQAMTFNPISGKWIVTFGASLAVNTYNITVTATDTAGNTSSSNDILAVYTTANGYVTGHAKMLPTATDTLPIAIDTSGNPTKLVLGFTNVTAPASGSFDINYAIKNNQNEFSLSSTGINWVIVQDSNHSSILGHADMTKYVNGVKTVTQNVAVRFDITLGTSGAPDQVSIKVFNPGVDPNSGSPAYVINDSVISNGSNLRIHP